MKTLKDGTKLFGKPNTLLSNEPGIGNMHFVQMVFQDSFEVDTPDQFAIIDRLTSIPVRHSLLMQSSNRGNDL
jgi:hypothetical protein